MKIILILLFLSISASVTGNPRYELVFIDDLSEQQIGRIVVEEIYRQLNIPVRITAEPAARSERSTALGKVDGEVMRIESYGDENHHVVRVPTPYYSVKTMAFVRKGSGIVINTPEDLKSYSVARVRGIKHTRNVSMDAKRIVELNSSQKVIEFIRLGRADVALTSALEGAILIRQFKLDDVIPMERPLKVLNLYHYLHKDHEGLVKRIDEKITALKASGELAQIVAQAEQRVLNRL